VDLAGVDEADVAGGGDMGGTLVVRCLDATLYDTYGEGIMGVPGKGMPHEGGVEELQPIKVGSPLKPDDIAATLQFHFT
jgi:hypothetical protein